MTTTAIITVEQLDLRPLVYKGERCVTFRLIDAMHGRPEGTAGAAFRRNRARLKEGKHYHCVPYNDPVLIRHETSDQNGGNRKPVYLLTEKGYCLIAKVFDDDRAWLVQDELIDGYFRKTAVLQSRPWSTRISDYITRFDGDVAMQRPNCWAIAPRIMVILLTIEDCLLEHGYPLDIGDLPDGSAGRRWASFRKGQLWAGDVHNDVGLETPHVLEDGHKLIVYPAIYHQSEHEHFNTWFRRTYVPSHLPEYLANKSDRDRERWLSLGVTPPEPIRVIKAADAACRRLTGQPARLSKKQQAVLLLDAPGNKQLEMFSES